MRCERAGMAQASASSETEATMNGYKIVRDRERDWGGVYTEDGFLMHEGHISDVDEFLLDLLVDSAEVVQRSVTIDGRCDPEW